MPRNLVLMGSGETSPTMTTEHQRILASVPARAGACALLETPYGFQENADELTARITQYFAGSVGRDIVALPMRSAADAASIIAATVAGLRAAEWVFAGPGSPTYALRNWADAGIGPALADVLDRGTIVFASAAALTVGSHTMPVYEMYKVGEAPSWRTGLDLLASATGLRAAVVPHFDNTDGGTHDTRFCFVGERRMHVLEQQLPDDVFILGIDEHTGVRFELESRRVHVFGRGGMTVRMGGRIWVVPAGSEVGIDDIAEHAGTRLAGVDTQAAPQFTAESVHALLDEGNVDDAVDALLALDDVDRDLTTRAAVHSLVLRLGRLAANPRVDVATVVAPFIDTLLEARASARKHGFWSEADAIRDRLTDLHVRISDGPNGSTWQIDSA